MKLVLLKTELVHVVYRIVQLCRLLLYAVRTYTVCKYTFAVYLNYMNPNNGHCHHLYRYIVCYNCI